MASAAQVTVTLADGNDGQFVAMLAVTALTMSGRGAPGGELDTVLQTCAEPVAWSALAPASAAASPTFWSRRRVTRALAPSSRSAPTARTTTRPRTNRTRI